MTIDKNNVGRHIREIIPLLLILLGAFLILVSRATSTGIWYDEAVEYFYSKIVSGPTPGDFGKESMYERICFTYQPPLYNVLMHIWLHFFDSEFSFRLAGILVTLIGAVGAYYTLMDFSGQKWALCGTIAYIFAGQVPYYALECAEYNLLLCCEIWLIYFGVRCMKYPSAKVLIGFFLMACIAAYSQYGAAFLIVGMFCSLFIFYIKNRREMLYPMIIMTIIIAVVAVLPLVCFFLIPQMQHQMEDGVSHIPQFQKNIFIDLGLGLYRIVSWGLTPPEAGIIVKILVMLIIVFFSIMTFFSIANADLVLKYLLFANLITWFVFYILVKFNFYGYGGFGDRYGLFFVPLWFITLAYGAYMFVNSIKKKGKYVRVKEVILRGVFLCTILYVLIGVMSVLKGWDKEDIREATEIWYERQGYEELTFVHQWSDANFQFYLTHDAEYNEQYQTNIVTAEKWIRKADYNQMLEQCEGLGLFEEETFYYIGPIDFFPDSTITFIKVMENEGYVVTRLWDGKSTLLYCKKE